MERLEPPAVRDVPAGQPVEQLGMRRRAAVEAEVAGRGDDPLAEVVVPDPVDHHPRRQRIGRVADPARQGEPALALGGVLRRARAAGRSRRPPREPPRRPAASGRRGGARGSGRAGRTCRRRSTSSSRAGPAARAARPCRAIRSARRAASSDVRPAGSCSVGLASARYGTRSSDEATTCHSPGFECRLDVIVGGQPVAVTSSRRSRPQTTRSIVSARGHSIVTTPLPGTREIQLWLLPDLAVVQMGDLVDRRVGILGRGRGLAPRRRQRDVPRRLARPVKTSSSSMHGSAWLLVARIVMRIIRAATGENRSTLRRGLAIGRTGASRSGRARGSNSSSRDSTRASSAATAAASAWRPSASGAGIIRSACFTPAKTAWRP